MIRSLTVVISIVVLLRPSLAVGAMEQWLKDHGGPYKATEEDLRYLPPYCRGVIPVNQDKHKNEKKKWSSVFRSKGARGKDWMHVHHYCHALLMLSRLDRGLGKKSALLKTAEAELNYMIEMSSPQFILMPEIHLKMGIIQKRMGRPTKAIEHFLRAKQLKRDYVPAYMHIIDFFMEHHDLANAIETARTGLKYKPDSTLLKAKLRELQSVSKTPAGG